MAPPTKLPEFAGERPGRLAALASIAAVLALGACAGPQYAEAVPELAAARDRFEADGATGGYTAVVPRAYLDVEDLDEDAPNEYTVIKGDTLWDISDRFLKKPWLWTTIWNYNPEIANPHLIYPGDKLALEYVGDRPVLVLSRNGRALPTADMAGGGRQIGVDANGEPLLGAATAGVERLSPRIRSSSLDDAIPTIPGDAIASFLVHPRVVAQSETRRAPYVVGNFDNRLISAVDHQVYVRGDIDPSVTSYGIYRKSEELRDPITNELLGHQIDHVADARLLAVGDPSTLVITRNRKETIAGDIILPMGAEPVDHSYTPRMPEIRGDGRIVTLVNAITQSGRDQVVVLNLGERSGIKAGDVLAIETRGKEFIDRRGRGGFEHVNMPNTRTGVLMVFRTFEKVSYALIMESTRPVMIDDIVTGI